MRYGLVFISLALAWHSPVFCHETLQQRPELQPEKSEGKTAQSVKWYEELLSVSSKTESPCPKPPPIPPLIATEEIVNSYYEKIADRLRNRKCPGEPPPIPPLVAGAAHLEVSGNDYEEFRKSLEDLRLAFEKARREGTMSLDDYKKGLVLYQEGIRLYKHGIKEYKVLLSQRSN